MLRNRTIIRMILITLVLLFIFDIYPYKVHADDQDEEEINEIELQKIVETNTKAYDEPILNSKSAIVYDRTSKRVLFKKDENSKRAMASTTKIMTAIIVLENKALDEVVTISKKAANTGGSRLKINTGDRLTVNDLLYGLMLRSRQ